MLIGEYHQNIDAKGRINIPAKFRLDLGESFVVAKGLDNCVYLYPKAAWERFEEELCSVPPTQRRRLHRFFFSGAEECSADTQGRVVIPPKIREYAGLQKEIVVIGVSDKIEVWGLEQWNRYMEDPAFEAEEIAKVMEDLGI